jgi:hypothetical protein
MVCPEATNFIGYFPEAWDKKGEIQGIGLLTK